MKILEVVPVFSDPFGGPVAVVRSISKELAKRHDVVVYTTTALDPWHDFAPKEEKIDGYRVIYFRRTFRQLSYIGILGQLNLSFGMMQAVKQNLRKFDVVHVHSWQQFPDVLIHHYATKYDVPYVLQVHGSLPKIMTKQTLKHIFDVLFGYRLLRDASKVIALSKREARQYRDMGVLEGKVVVVPNAIDPTEYDNPPYRGSFKKKVGIAEDEQIVLYLGRLHQSKGLELMVEAFRIVAKKSDKIKFVAIGPDDGYRAKFVSLLINLGIAEKVILTGFVDKKTKMAAFVDSRVFVTPSYYGFPMTFLEACAFGVPIVATNFGDSLEWIDGNVGCEVPPTASDLASALYSMVSDDKLHDIYSRNCIEAVHAEFSIDHVVNKLDQVYSEVAKKRSNRSR